VRAGAAATSAATSSGFSIGCALWPASFSALPFFVWLRRRSTARTPRSGERIKAASGPITRYGWNVEEDRWSYGEGPPGSRELTPLMKLVL
jgi:hypothetical protein